MGPKPHDAPPAAIASEPTEAGAARRQTVPIAWIEEVAADALRLLDAETAQLIEREGGLTQATLRKVLQARSRAESELSQLQQRISRALDGSGIGVWEWDAATDRIWLSESIINIAGLRDATPDGYVTDFRRFIHSDDRAVFDRAFMRCVSGESRHLECEFRHRARTGWIWVLDRGTAVERDAAGHATKIAGTLTVITARKEAERKLRWTLNHDPLTELPNRRLFAEMMAESLKKAGWNGAHVAVVLMDLDDFKDINDAYGHAAGDALLVGLAERMKSLLHDGEWVARLGGDEFIFAMPFNRANMNKLDARLQVLQDRLREPMAHEGRVLDCRASFGVTVFPDDGRDASVLLRNADMAMYQAKANGSGMIARFSDDMRATIEARVVSRAAVRDALTKNAIQPFYQAKVDLGTGHVLGFEALTRVNGDDGLARSFGEGSVAFEDAELAVQLGDRILASVTKDLAVWHAAGIDPGDVAINASAAEFVRGDYARRVLAALAANGLPASSLQVEVTESVFLGRGADKVGSALGELRGAGVRVALDDFGTGYASLTHLKHYPVDMLKIDRRFVADVPESEGSAAIVRAIIGLSRGFGVDLIAEGVETEAQRAFLMEEGCTFAQGFLFHRPVPSRTVPDLVRIGRPRPTSAKKKRAD